MSLTLNRFLILESKRIDFWPKIENWIDFFRPKPGKNRFFLKNRKNRVGFFFLHRKSILDPKIEKIDIFLHHSFFFYFFLTINLFFTRNRKINRFLTEIEKKICFGNWFSTPKSKQIHFDRKPKKKSIFWSKIEKKIDLFHRKSIFDPKIEKNRFLTKSRKKRFFLAKNRKFLKIFGKNDFFFCTGNWFLTQNRTKPIFFYFQIEIIDLFAKNQKKLILTPKIEKSIFLTVNRIFTPKSKKYRFFFPKIKNIEIFRKNRKCPFLTKNRFWS